MAWDRIIKGRSKAEPSKGGIKNTEGLRGAAASKAPAPKPFEPLHLPKFHNDRQVVAFLCVWMSNIEPPLLTPGLRAELLSNLRLMHLRSKLLSEVMGQLTGMEHAKRKTFVVNMLRGCWLRLLPDPAL